jgi:cyclic-di-AMP phosphodiesterase PgpH
MSTKFSVKNIALYTLIAFLYSVLIVFLGVALLTNKIDSIVSSYGVMIPMIFAVLFALMMLFIYQSYIIKHKFINGSQLREVLIIFTMVTLIVAFTCTLSIKNPYVVPMSAAALLVSILIGQRIAVMTSVSTFFILMILCPTTTYFITKDSTLLNGSLSQILGLMVGLISSVSMCFLVHRGYTRLKITLGALIIAVIVSLLGIPLGFIEKNYTYQSITLTVGYIFIGNAIAIGTTTILLPIFERLFRIWTDFRLAEICSMNQPLLKELREKAPGTFSHSMTVSILAEASALAIGLNPFMAKACAMYHDIGKIKNPQFFTENQEGGYNPHDDLIIDVSVKMITEHPEEGAEILKQHHMPDTIVKVAHEHHGNSTLMFFYLKAKGLTEGDLETDEYRYNDPKPSTKYSAIIMICDMAEATIRAVKPQTKDDMENIVYNIIQGRITDGQFTNCDISLLELSKIKDTICEVMPALLHQRIDYKKAEENR